MEASAEPGALGGCRVLVVEDEYYIADDLVHAIRRIGGEVLGPAATREKALELLDKAERVDVALLDIDLRGQAVHDVADALAARDVPFVFVTGYEPRDLPDRFARVPCWTKPVDPEALMRTLPEARTGA